MAADDKILAALDAVPALFVDHVGVGSCPVVGPDGSRTHRVLRLFLADGPLDLVMTEEVAALVGTQLLEPADGGVVVDHSGTGAVA